MRLGPTVQLGERIDAQTGACRLVVRGIETCGSVHSCPTCAARIMAHRAGEVTQALDANARDCSALVTFTLRHHKGSPLPMLRKLLALSYSQLKAGRTGKRLRDDLTIHGDLRSAEVTIGRDNGWHPHLHSLFFARTPIDAERWREQLAERWRLCVANTHARIAKTLVKAKQIADTPGEETDEAREAVRRVLGGFYVRPERPLREVVQIASRDFAKLGGLAAVLPNDAHGVDVERIEDNEGRVGRYLSKLGLEVSSFSGLANEDHLSTWQLARLAASGDRWAAQQWQIHGRAMLGARQLTWSRGLRARLGLEPERVDADIADDEVPGPEDTERLVGFIAARDWDPLAKRMRQGLVAELHRAHHEGRLGDLYYVQAAIHPPHRGLRKARPPPDVRPTWWDRNGRALDARARGRARAQVMAEIAGEKEHEEAYRMIPLADRLTLGRH